ncbi:hypothetical protein Y032_0134g1845 [Ancylostoma ceylanicum]|uniref:Uncharacterized protein n=1 Tax=Ancylostoma ceylanicum TaxID=53326 RepID=A0A016T5V8_9BILA|nr:hypothetical protein Y032_0134g1845 [Ancylostoma ceylanicum]
MPRSATTEGREYYWNAKKCSRKQVDFTSEKVCAAPRLGRDIEASSDARFLGNTGRFAPSNSLQDFQIALETRPKFLSKVRLFLNLERFF